MKKPIFKCLSFTAICLIVLVLFVMSKPNIPTQADGSDFSEFLDSQIPILMLKHDVQGVSVAWIHDSRVAYSRGFGFADNEKTRPVTDTTLFQAASISKALTAWGVLDLVENGLIDLDAPVSRYLTRWQLPPTKFALDQVTIRRLLSHSSGVAHVGGYSGFESLNEIQSLEQSLTSPEDADSKGVRVVYEPGSRYVYSGGAFTLLQLVIEEVTGLSFEEYMKTSILLPLGMNESGFESIPAEKEVVSVVFNHQNEIANGRFFAAKAAAGLYTSSSDLASLALAMMLTEVNSQTVNILTDTTLREMYQPQPGLSMRTPYGLGYMLQILPSSGLTEVSHTGSNKPGWNSLITTLPQKGEGLVILTNSPGGLQLRQELGKDWLFWTTGEVSFADRINKMVNGLVFMLPSWIIGLLLLLLIPKIKFR